MARDFVLSAETEPSDAIADPTLQTGHWESRLVEEDHRDPGIPKLPGNKTLAEAHAGRFQSRAADGDGGKGLAEWSAAEAQKKSHLHSGGWQRRAGARLAGKFEPRRMYEGYGRGRGALVPEDPNPWEHDDDDDDFRGDAFPISLPPPSADAAAISDWLAREYEERDPNFMDGDALRRFKAKQRRNVEAEYEAMLTRVARLSGTVRVHADSKLPPKPPRKTEALSTPCWAEPEPVWRAVDSDEARAAQTVPWGTLGTNVRCVPTGAGVSARPGTRDAIVTSAAESYSIVGGERAGTRVGDEAVPVPVPKSPPETRDASRPDASANARNDEPGASRRVSYFGRESHHKEYRAVRGVGVLTKSVRVPPKQTPEELRRRPPPRPAVALHAGYLELDGGLPAYVAGMRARDEALLPVDRHANAPRRDGVRRVKYFDHRKGRKKETGEEGAPSNENETSAKADAAAKWTVLEKPAPRNAAPVAEDGAGCGANAKERTVRPTKPAVILKGRAALEAKKRDYPYGPCTF